MGWGLGAHSQLLPTLHPHKTFHMLPRRSLSGAAHWTQVQSWETDNPSNFRLCLGWGLTSCTINTSLRDPRQAPPPRSQAPPHRPRPAASAPPSPGFSAGGLGGSAAAVSAFSR